MVHVNFRCRLGNNLFQYAFGRIVAEEMGYYLSADPITGFPGTADRIAGNVYQSPERIYAPWECSFEKIVSDKTERRIVIDGFAQCYHHFVGREQRVRSWLGQGENNRVPAIHPDDIVIHVRLGDYRDIFQASMPDYKTYFEPILSGLQFRRAYLCAEDFADPFLKPFNRFDCIPFRGDAVDVVRLMQRSRRLIICQSTLSWWGAFLSNAEQIYVPNIPGSLWSSGQLNVPDARYIHWPCRSIEDTWWDRQNELTLGAPRRFMSQKFRPDVGSPVI